MQTAVHLTSVAIEFCVLQTLKRTTFSTKFSKQGSQGQAITIIGDDFGSHHVSQPSLIQAHITLIPQLLLSNEFVVIELVLFV